MLKELVWVPSLAVNGYGCHAEGIGYTTEEKGASLWVDGQRSNIGRGCVDAEGQGLGYAIVIAIIAIADAYLGRCQNLHPGSVRRWIAQIQGGH